MEAPETYMPKLRRFLARLRVTVTEDKSRVVAAQDGFNFLGVHFRKQPSRRDTSKWFYYCWLSQRSMQRIRDKVKAAIGRDNRPTLQEKFDRLKPDTAGVIGIPLAGSTQPKHFRKVDQYVTWRAMDAGPAERTAPILDSTDEEVLETELWNGLRHQRRAKAAGPPKSPFLWPPRQRPTLHFQ